VFFAFDLLHLNAQDLRGRPLMERRELLIELIRPDNRSPSNSVTILSATALSALRPLRRSGWRALCPSGAISLYHGGPSRSWLKTKNMVESEFILLGTDGDANGIPWALLASDRDGALRFVGPAILHPAQSQRKFWSQQIAALVVADPPLKGLRRGSAQWLRPELRVQVKHLKAKGVLRHAIVKQAITD
jgi:bifunctional non-homologous end joining protein LigD